jgi:2-oxoglutarate dehydrogenase E1 component
MQTHTSTLISTANLGILEPLYEAFLRDPDIVDPAWREVFSNLADGAGRPHPIPSGAADAGLDDRFQKQVAVLQLINAYRFRGHRQADLDPLRQYERPEVAELDPAYHGLTDEDLDTTFNTGSLVGPAKATLREILDILRATYCRTVGAEYMHINDTHQKRWIQQRLEAGQGQPGLSPAKRHRILERLVAATTLEQFLHRKYVGQKRFSLEGGESTIPLLDDLVQGAGRLGVKEVVIGMAHRGRINVLVNTVGKHPAELFDEFEGKGKDGAGSGDVKYHLGYSSDIATPGGPVHLTLSFNPSHLEIIDPVVQGSVRARQERRRDKTRNSVLPILLHGDAAFAGQGVVMETLNLSQTRGYTTGGTIHVVVNNQIGFTTSDPLDSRSTLYCTDVAKMVQAPILHVNGDDPEAVVMVAGLALDYRMEFNKDVVIDLVCYRKHGHSEADEPAATQPIMYQKIRQQPPVVETYAAKLVAEGVVGPEERQALEQHYVGSLEHNEVVAGALVYNIKNELRVSFEAYHGKHWREPCETQIPSDRIRALAERFTEVPGHFKLHRAVTRIIEQRREMANGKLPMDWGFAETLAYASLVDEGHPVRLSGQDSERGTFFHRHAVIHDQKTDEKFVPLQHIRAGQASFLAVNSILSEEAVLGFEYGFSSSEPNALVVWEAQFGDFANGAQVVIDQFITSCEAKWGRLCGLVLLLPHGYDGQGPEHSSARLERYLQLAAEENIQVCVPSTPAQCFHLLRRQVLRRYRKPLVVMSPKSLLRHRLATSTLPEITHGRFEPVMHEVDPLDPKGVDRVLVCSGKVYFDLLEARRAHKIQDTAIVRVEQLYPFPVEEMDTALAAYPNALDVVWVQEEPRNQGAWVYLLARLHLFSRLHEPQQLRLVARPYSASPAVGYSSKHLQQQQALVDEALRLDRMPMARQKTA